MALPIIFSEGIAFHLLLAAPPARGMARPGNCGGIIENLATINHSVY
jgi:hypothetical protein